MPNASDIADSIEPGSLEYGDRQVVADRIQAASSQRNAASAPGAATAATQGRLAAGPVSDLPITDGLSVGPGAGADVKKSAPGEDQLRMIALNARNPLLRKIARDALVAITQKVT